MAKSNKSGKKPANKREKKPAKKAAKKQIKKTAKKKVKKTFRKKVVPQKIPLKRVTTRAATATREITLRRGELEERTTLDTLYILDGSNNNVTLEVNAGAKGQANDMSIELDGNIIVDKLAGDFPETTLGTNQELNRKRLRIVATITDLSRETNVTSLTVRLKGGPADTDFLLAKEVEREGASVDYICLIRFFQPL